jgi:hypothetical protein
MGLGTLAAAVGKGLAAGLAGTAVMTVSSTVEMRLTNRAGSTVPADALEAALGVEARGEAEKTRLATIGHWGYGTSLGAVRGLLAAIGLSGPAAAAAHFGQAWGSQQIVLPLLGVAEPTWRYGAAALATDAWHHAVYVVATSAAYEWLDRH